VHSDEHCIAGRKASVSAFSKAIAAHKQIARSLLAPLATDIDTKATNKYDENAVGIVLKNGALILTALASLTIASSPRAGGLNFHDLSPEQALYDKGSVRGDV
jgi:hypothetical protein